MKTAKTLTKKIQVLTLSLTAALALSQEKTAEVSEIVLKGNRLTIPFSQSSRDIQVIQAEDIKKLPAKSLNELLSFVGGVDVKQRGPFGTQADISIDGGTFEQTLVMINGIKILDAQTAHNMMNLPITADAIERIEILRGAAARLYGINALTGAINFVVKKNKNPFLLLDVFAGSSFKKKETDDGSGVYAGGGLQFTGNYGTDRQSHLFSFGTTKTNGHRYNSAQEGYKFFYTGNVSIQPEHALEIVAGFYKNRFGANGFYAAPGDRNSQESVSTTLVSVSSKHQFGDLTLSPRISDRYNEDDYRYLKDTPTVGRSRHYTNALMAELNASLSRSFGTLGFGWESRFEKIRSTNIGGRERENHGAYAEFKTQLGENLYANLGAYLNYNTDFGWKIYPGLDVSYSFAPHWKIGGSLGTGERIPSFTDLYLNQKPGNVGNPNLQPENAWQYETSLRYAANKTSFQTGYFHREIRDFIDWVRENATVPYSPVNLRENKVNGFFARAAHTLSLGADADLGLKLSYNYLSPSALSDTGAQSKYILESLRHQAIATVSFSAGSLGAQLENRWLKRELNAAYNLTDLRLSYQLRSFQIYTDLTNIFDAQYKESGAVPMPTRWVALGVRYAWEK